MEHYGTIQGLAGSSLQILLLHHWSHWGTSKVGHRRLSPEPANSDMSAFEVLVTQSESWALDFLFALWSAQLSVATRKMISTRRWGELDISTEHQESPYSAVGFSVESLQAQSLLSQMLTVNMFYHQNYACCVGPCYPSTSYMNEYIYIIYLHIGIYKYVYTYV